MRRNASRVPRVFVDFDGTIADSSQRQYELFRELAGSAAPSYADYWSCKRAGVSTATLLRLELGWGRPAIESFHSQWLSRIEDPMRLEMDALFPNVKVALQRAASERSLVIVSGRQNENRLRDQLARLGVSDLFEQVVVTQQKAAKADLVESLFWCGPYDVFIGDSTEDILAGRALGVMTVAVTSGATNGRLLRACHPDALVPSLVDALGLAPKNHIVGGWPEEDGF